MEIAPPSVVAVLGSPRQGNTSYLVDVALEEFGAHGARCEKIRLVEWHIQPCEGHDECATLPACPVDDDMPQLLDKVYSADLLLLATPVYYENVSGLMKLFIDRNCHHYNHELFLAAKAVGLLAVAQSSGLEETIAALRRYVAFSSNERLQPLAVTGFAYSRGEAAANPDLIENVRRLAVDMWQALDPSEASAAPSPRHS
jgi:multimeric flavodoxin WrbA